MDSDISGQAFHEKTGGSPNGERQRTPEGWEAIVRPGRILYEMEGVPKELAREALKLASSKLPVKTRFVERGEVI